MHVPLYLPVSNLDQRPETGALLLGLHDVFMLKQNMPKLSEISERFAVPKKPFFYIIAGSIFKGAAQTWPPRTT